MLESKVKSEIKESEENDDQIFSSGEYSLEDDDLSSPETEFYEEEGDDEEEDPEGGGKRSSSLKLLFSMMINPVEGWKKIRRAKMSPETMARGCFFPLLAIAAASCFLECLYNSATTLSMAMVEGVKIFVAFFFGYYVSLLFIRVLMPRDKKGIADSSFGKQYVMYLLSTLAIFWVLYAALPMLGPVIAFLPLWTIYLAIRGARFFRFSDDRKNLLTTLLCLTILGAPILMYYIFDILLPVNEF